MAYASEQINQLLEASLQVEFLQGQAGGVAFPYSTGWRTLPFVVAAQWQGNDMCYEREGHAPLLLRDGEAALTPTGVHHRLSTLGETIYCRWAHLRFTLFGAVDILSLLAVPPIMPRPQSERIGDICEALGATSSGDAIPMLTGIIRKQALCMQLLELIVTAAPFKPEGLTQLTRISRLAPVLRYLETHQAGKITRDELAALINLSSPQFHAVFKSAMGISPMEYLKRRRIHRAQELLMQTDLPVAAVAAQVGFRDPFHFSRQFHAACGSSPRLYRQQLRVSLSTQFHELPDRQA